MKYLHFIKDRKFAQDYINFINDYFDNNEHYFLVLGHDKDLYNLKYEENVQFISRKQTITILPKIYKKVQEAEKIYIHCLTEFEDILCFIWPSMRKKVNWVMWGGDLWFYKYRERGLKFYIIERIRRIIIKNFKQISYLASNDFELAKKWYYTKAKPVYAIYPSLSLLDFQNNDLIKSKSLNILIGNSAIESNNHFDAFNKLKHLKDENINVFCPLSYGDSEYRQKVIDEGKKIFDNKFNPIIEFMSVDEYYNFLSKIDVGIFAFDRQQGLNNIRFLVLTEKQIYLKKETSVWEDFDRIYDIQLSDYSKLENVTFEELKYPDYKKIKSNKEKFADKYSYDYIVAVWKENFES